MQDITGYIELNTSEVESNSEIVHVQSKDCFEIEPNFELIDKHGEEICSALEIVDEIKLAEMPFIPPDFKQVQDPTVTKEDMGAGYKLRVLQQVSNLGIETVCKVYNVTKHDLKTWWANTDRIANAVRVESANRLWIDVNKAILENMCFRTSGNYMGCNKTRQAAQSNKTHPVLRPNYEKSQDEFQCLNHYFVRSNGRGQVNQKSNVKSNHSYQAPDIDPCVYRCFPHLKPRE